MLTPNNPDSDGDGLNDGYEINTSLTIPNVADTDADGLSMAMKSRAAQPEQLGQRR